MLRMLTLQFHWSGMIVLSCAYEYWRLFTQFIVNNDAFQAWIWAWLGIKYWRHIIVRPIIQYYQNGGSKLCSSSLTIVLSNGVWCWIMVWTRDDFTSASLLFSSMGPNNASTIAILVLLACYECAYITSLQPEAFLEYLVPGAEHLSPHILSLQRHHLLVRNAAGNK